MPSIRPIRSAEKQNFQTLIAAVQAGNACLMSVFDTNTCQPAVLVCAVNHHAGHPEPFEFVPLAILCDGDAYSRFVPPVAAPIPPLIRESS